MSLFDIFVIGVALSMDAFAVSVCKGLATGKFSPRVGVICGLWFGGFQALMPAIGYILGNVVTDFVHRYAGIIAFVLLGYIGLNMIKEAREEDSENDSGSVDPKTMLTMAVATSIDALTVGVTFSAYDASIVTAAGVIGVTTFLFSFAGVGIGSYFGDKYQKKAEMAGGIILILMGIKFLLG